MLYHTEVKLKVFGSVPKSFLLCVYGKTFLVFVIRLQDLI